MTDSELVPWGKGEKQPGEGGEIDLKPCAYKELEPVTFTSLLVRGGDSVLFVERSNESVCTASLSYANSEGAAKASVNSAIQ